MTDDAHAAEGPPGSYVVEIGRIVTAFVERVITERSGGDTVLARAMGHAVLAGGKRLRPVLCVAACELVGGTREVALPAAAALEMVHTYSLVHDDLPAMDDDALRRGKPTTHVVFGEALAILAGDALLTDAFAVLAGARAEPARVLAAVVELATAAGSGNMVGGQAQDLLHSGVPCTLETVAGIHRQKTAAMFRASATIGALLGGGTDLQRDALARYGTALGRAFQVADDVRDDTLPASELGKTPGTDARLARPSICSVLAPNQARELAASLLVEAREALAPFPDGDPKRVLLGLVTRVGQSLSIP